MTKRWESVRSGLLAAVDLVLPSGCAACRAVGGPLCGPCTGALRAAARGMPCRVSPGHGGARPPPGVPPCWAGARFEGALRAAVTAYKDEGRRDLREVLAGLLAGALSAATHDDLVRRRLALGEEVLVVPVPTSRGSRRRRGDDPVADLAVAAVSSLTGVTARPAVTGGPASGAWAAGSWAAGGSAAGGSAATAGDHHPRRGRGGPVVAPALVHTRRVADQAHLDRRSRAANVAGSMAVLPAWREVVRGSTCIVVDDVVTTGATLAEAARALRSAGARHVVAATCATTRRHSRPLPLWATGRPTSVVA